MSDYVCTYWVQTFGRCGRPGTWNGRTFRCDFHVVRRPAKPRRDKIQG